VQKQKQYTYGKVSLEHFFEKKKSAKKFPLKVWLDEHLVLAASVRVDGHGYGNETGGRRRWRDGSHEEGCTPQRLLLKRDDPELISDLRSQMTLTVLVSRCIYPLYNEGLLLLVVEFRISYSLIMFFKVDWLGLPADGVLQMVRTWVAAIPTLIFTDTVACADEEGGEK
jgi:hypothetical protein